MLRQEILGPDVEEKRPRENEERYRAILEGIEDGYYEVDLAGNFTLFNDSLCRMFGYPPDELLGMNNRQYMDKEDAREVYQLINQVYRTGETAKALDWKIIRKDGIRRFLEASVSLMRDAAGQPTGFRGILRDVTERKRLEEQLRDTVEKLKASQEELSTPVVQIWDRVLALPLIGVVDSLRAQKIMETLLNRIVETQSEMVILDITGVSSIDTQVVNHLIKTIQAAKLLGAECVITGIKPEIAQTMIQLGLDMQSFPTRRSLRDGLMYALEKLGYRVGGRE
ncbi:PAS domain S-box protein [Dehalococcoidia bacterium]|nr:PAS domain S-box protein [Dehalococcoidia bacterium]